MIIEPRGQMMIVCPCCKFGSKYSTSYIEDAIRDNLEVVCVVCEQKFIIQKIAISEIESQQ